MYKEREKGNSLGTTQRSVRIPRALFLLLFCLRLATTTPAQQTPPRAELDPNQAAKLAELMCSQLPNVGTILEIVRVQTPNSAPPPAPSQEPIVTDDVYDTLVRLGPYSLPCLTDHLLDTRWMPDPRSEPLLGAPLVGDVDYMILMDKGVETSYRPWVTSRMICRGCFTISGGRVLAITVSDCRTRSMHGCSNIPIVAVAHR